MRDMSSVLLQPAVQQIQQQGLPKHAKKNTMAFQINLADVSWLATWNLKQKKVTAVAQITFPFYEVQGN